MLSDANVSKINDQIDTELNTVDSFRASDEEKMAAIERIAKLKELLSPQPSRTDIITELATALSVARAPEPTPAQSPLSIIADLLASRR